MSGKRTELLRLCESLFSNCSNEVFMKTLHTFKDELAAVAARGQYTIVSYAQGLMDEHLDKGRVDSEDLIVIANFFPVKLSACTANLCRNKPELATSLANNIVRHEDFHSDSSNSIQEIITAFVECGYPEQAMVILEGLFNMPYGHHDFDHGAFISVLHDAFEYDSAHIIKWAMDNEERILQTDIRYCSSRDLYQFHGNMLFKKGLKKLGALIMQRKPENASSLELFERELFTGHGVSSVGSICRDHGAIVAYMLGTPELTHEWFATDFKEINGSHLSRVNDLRKIGVVVPNERIELVATILIAISNSSDNIYSIYKELSKLNITINDELLSVALNQAMPNVWDGIKSLIAFKELSHNAGVVIDYSGVVDKIDRALEAWQSSWHSEGQLLGCMHACLDGFPVPADRLARYVDVHWSRWNEKQRNSLHENAPKNVSNLSTYLKGMRLEEALGL